MDDSVAVPPSYRPSPIGNKLGRIGNEETVAQHSFAVLSCHQKSDFGRALLQTYITQTKHTNGVVKISLMRSLPLMTRC